MAKRKCSFSCACCGAYFEDTRRQDPSRDTGYGLCAICKPIYARDALKYGWNGKEYATFEEALARFERYA